MFSQAERPNPRQIHFLRVHKLCKPDQTQRKGIRKLYVLYERVVFVLTAFELECHGSTVKFRVKPRHKIIAIQNRQHVIPPAALWRGHIRFPFVFKPNQLL